MLLFLCAFSLLAAVSGETQNPLCQKCRCSNSLYNEKMVYMANCSYAGFDEKNIALLEHLPESTEVFVFQGHKVSVLPKNLFGEGKNFTKLRVIDMSNNNIEEIKGKTFHHVPAVELLILNHNSIDLNKKSHTRVFSNLVNLKELHLTDAFLDYNQGDLAAQLHIIFIDSNLTQLEKLHLEQNEIKSFAEKHVFCDLKHLMDLHLGDNKMDTLNFDIKCLPHLRYLDLEGNRITHFTKEELSAFDSFPPKHEFFMDIHRNPFICDCGVNNLQTWFNRTKVRVKNNETLRCHFFRNNSSALLNDFNTSYCNGPYGYSNSDVELHRYAKYFMFFTTFVLAVFLSYLSVKYYFQYCRHSITPAGKVHYVVIQNQDENKDVRVDLKGVANV